MKKFVNNLYKNQALFYKVFLFALTAVLIVYLLPRGGNFKYEIPKGKPWQYENLYAPFDFAILKSEEEIQQERQQIRNNHTPYFQYNQEIPKQVKAEVPDVVYEVFPDSLLSNREIQIIGFVNETLEEVYEFGLLQANNRVEDNQLVYLRKGNEAFEISYKNILKQDEVRSFLNTEIEQSNLSYIENELLEVFFNLIEPNVSFDSEFTQKELESKLDNISYTRGNIEQGSRVIARGEVVEGNKYNILRSLKNEYESQVWSESNYKWIIVGYSVLVALALLMLLLFIRKYRQEIFENNVKVTFIFFNILFMVLLTTLVVNFNIDYVYVVPLCILPLTLKA
ncbi:MAG: phosphohydrolase, partial [Salegentibacter mishustinae]|nr:phosphohydrolase [Salegentibacter mishustinae]